MYIVFMLIINSIERISIRSGEKMRTRDMAPIRRMLESSETIREFEKSRRPKSGKLTYSCIDLMMVLLWMEVKKTTLGGVVADLTDHGGQQKLATFGLPVGKDGERLCPCESTLCEFRAKVLPLFIKDLSKEISRTYLDSLREPRFYTCDSTPLEASRYAWRCEYSPHYEIRMDKLHMIMVNGMPIAYRHTGANVGDNPQLLDMLSDVRAENPTLYEAFMTDGAYHSFQTYAEVFRATGKVMATNQGVDTVFHPEATWKKLLDRYNRMWRNRDFGIVKHRTPREIMLYLMNHGQSDLVGRFLHNLDFFRGRVARATLSLKRHLCETVHFDAKRWIRLDVRGLHDRNATNIVAFRFLSIQILSLVFVSLDE